MLALHVHPDPAPGAVRPAIVVKQKLVKLTDLHGNHWTCTFPLNRKDCKRGW